MSNERILVVEDEQDILELVRLCKFRGRSLKNRCFRTFGIDRSRSDAPQNGRS